MVSVKPAPFNYRSPETLESALEILATDIDGARVLAGGQSLVPILNFRLSRFDSLVDINRLTELSYIRVEGDELRIGALTRQRGIERSGLVRKRAPLLAEATRCVAHAPIRSRGTIGGSIAHADPAAEYPAVLLALDATIVARSIRGVREIAAGNFFRAVFTTALEADELIVEIRFPVARPSAACAFEEISRRKGDFALVGIATMLELDGGRIITARLAACGAGDMATRLSWAERLLESAPATDSLVEEAGSAAAASLSPRDDLHASAEYRRHLVALFVRRTVGRALRRAEQGAAA
jgi:carbon-monoxide dehydrogenase medium subunit